MTICGKSQPQPFVHTFKKVIRAEMPGEVKISGISLPPLWHVGVFLTYGTNISHIKGYITLVLMHNGIVNGYQLLCDAHTVLEPRRGTAAFLLTVFRFHFFFLCVFQSDSPFFLFLGASIHVVCVKNL